MTNNEFKVRLNTIIFGTDTPAGKAFDVALIILILSSVTVLMLESVDAVAAPFQRYLRIAEWAFTIIFTFEYMLRFYCSPQPFRYASSFYGLTDMCSVLPSYLSLLFPGANYLLIIRLVRVLRVFRILKLVRYIKDANILLRSMVQARRKITVFFCLVLVLSAIFGSLMYIVEGPHNGFSSIPMSIYWTIVTITTVGYGDITPHTTLGRIIASMAMLTGYSIFAVPTGILTAELSQEMQREQSQRRCHNCGRKGHHSEAKFCLHCGAEL